MSIEAASLLRHRFLDCPHRAFNLLTFDFAETRETLGQEFYPPLSSLPQDGRPFLRGLNHYSTAVLRIYGAAGQAFGHQGLDDAAHGGRTQLFGTGKGIQ